MRDSHALFVALAVVGVLSLVVVIAASWAVEAKGSTLVVGPILVVGDFVLRPWCALVVLLAIAGLFLLAAVRRRPKRPSAGSRWFLFGGAVCMGLVMPAATVSTAFVALAGVGDSYHVLAPASAGGCRVVVRESSLLLGGSGTVYLLPVGAFQPREANSYRADDGYRPVTFGTYSLRWSGETAHVELQGDPFAPVDYTAKPLTC